jgi:hypothetical protein
MLKKGITMNQKKYYLIRLIAVLMFSFFYDKTIAKDAVNGLSISKFDITKFNKDIIMDKVAKIIPLVGEVTLLPVERDIIKKVPLDVMYALFDIACFNGLSLLVFDLKDKLESLDKMNYFGLLDDIVNTKTKLKKKFDNKIVDRIDEISPALVTIFEKLCVMVIENKADAIKGDHKLRKIIDMLSNKLNSYMPSFNKWLKEDIVIAFPVLAGMNHDQAFFKKSNLWNLYSKVYDLFMILQLIPQVSKDFLKKKFHAINKGLSITIKPINFNMLSRLKRTAVASGVVAAAGITGLVGLSAFATGKIASEIQNKEEQLDRVAPVASSDTQSAKAELKQEYDLPPNSAANPSRGHAEPGDILAIAAGLATAGGAYVHNEYTKNNTAGGAGSERSFKDKIKASWNNFQEKVKNKREEFRNKRPSVFANEYLGKGKEFANEFANKGKQAANEYLGKGKEFANEYLGKGKQAASQYVEKGNLVKNDVNNFIKKFEDGKVLDTEPMRRWARRGMSNLGNAVNRDIKAPIAKLLFGSSVIAATAAMQPGFVGKVVDGNSGITHLPQYKIYPYEGLNLTLNQYNDDFADNGSWSVSDERRLRAEDPDVTSSAKAKKIDESRMKLLKDYMSEENLS